MLRTRLIPAIVLSDNRLINTKKFKESRYLGDPLNSIRIFNEKQADELIIFDISPKQKPNFKYLKKLSNACRMPVCYGGSINNVKDAENLINLGFEKISISSGFLEDRKLINKISNSIGRQSTVLTLNVRLNIFRSGYQVFSYKNKKIVFSLNEIIEDLKKRELGELIINCSHKDGMRDGYDLNLIKKVCDELQDKFVITICGGAKDIYEIKKLSKNYPRIG